MAIALVVLFVVGSLTASPARAAVLGWPPSACRPARAGAPPPPSCSLVLVLNPAFRLTWRGRTVLALTGIATVVAPSQTAAFQERFFFGGSGTLSDALTGGESLNTAGRRELWPRLVDDCSVAPLLGRGVGTGSLTSSDLTLGVLRQPHDDYLRTYCDVGLLGAVPFWAFFVAAGVSGLRLARRGDPLGQASAAAGLALLLLAVTDNPIIYTAHFMLPVGSCSGWRRADADRQPASTGCCRRPDRAPSTGSRSSPVGAEAGVATEEAALRRLPRRLAVAGEAQAARREVAAAVRHGVVDPHAAVPAALMVLPETARRAAREDRAHRTDAGVLHERAPDRRRCPRRCCPGPGRRGCWSC